MHFPFLSFAKRGWNALLNLGFSLFCVRFLFAAGRDSDWTFVMFSAGGFAVAWWRPAASLFVFVMCVPLLSGLGMTVFRVPYSPLLVIASSLWLGWTARKLFSTPPAESPPLEPVGSRDGATGRVALIVDVLAMIALLSLSMQIRRQGAAPDFWTRFWHQSFHGPTDPSYYLTSGFLWLQGLFLVRTILQLNLITSDGIKLFFLVQSILLIFFFGTQWLFEIPVRWTPGFASPFEDIATFGVVAACCLVFCLTLLRRGPTRWLILQGSAALLLAIAVGASWSRGSWLAGLTVLGALMFLRLRRSFALLISAALLGLIVFLNLNTKLIYSTDQHLVRLVSLVRFEDPLVKSSGRFELYHKAWAMIQVQPWVGHGIGMFPTASPRYARSNDPKGAEPQLAHNILLQLATEQGVPTTILFIGLISWTLWRGIRFWSSSHRLGAAGFKGPAPAQPPAHLVPALTLALAAYLQANMTWDILLVHPTQPFFFWFLMAALWATIDRASGHLGTPAENLG